MAFAELLDEEYDCAWYEAEEYWEEMEETLIARGFDADEVHEFFSEMAEDL